MGDAQSGGLRAGPWGCGAQASLCLTENSFVMSSENQKLFLGREWAGREVWGGDIKNSTQSHFNRKRNILWAAEPLIQDVDTMNWQMSCFPKTMEGSTLILGNGVCTRACMCGYDF